MWCPLGPGCWARSLCSWAGWPGASRLPLCAREHLKGYYTSGLARCKPSEKVALLTAIDGSCYWEHVGRSLPSSIKPNHPWTRALAAVAVGQVTGSPTMRRSCEESPRGYAEPPAMKATWGPGQAELGPWPVSELPWSPSAERAQRECAPRGATEARGERACSGARYTEASSSEGRE